MRGATPVKRCTCAASSAFSQGVRGTPGWPNTLNRVPEFPKAQEGSSISCPFSAALTAVRSRIGVHLHFQSTRYLRDCGSLHPLSGVQRSTIMRYACQELNGLRLSEVKKSVDPTRTVWSARPVSEPSSPAVSFWPCEPLSLPDATCTP